MVSAFHSVQLLSNPSSLWLKRVLFSSVKNGDANSNVIELQNIETIYEGEKIPVIHDINLNIKNGEFVSIIGPNGAGKTTLLETINGLLHYTEGKGYVFGMEILKNKTEIRKETGYVIQNFEIDPLSPFLCKDMINSSCCWNILSILAPIRFWSSFTIKLTSNAFIARHRLSLVYKV